MFGGEILVRYVSVKQNDVSDCGAACVATICKHYKKDVSIAKLKEITKTDTNGTTFAGLIRAFNDLGFDSKAVRINEDGLFSKFTLPCIAQLSFEDGYLHFVVIYKITKEKIIISDPQRGIVHYKVNDFLKVFNNALLLLIPNIEFQKTKDNESAVLQYIKMMGKHKKLFIYAFITSIILTGFGFISSFTMKYLIDEVLTNQLSDTLTIFFIGMLIFNIFQILVSFSRSHLLLYLSQKLDIELLSSYYRHILKLPIKFFQSRRIGEIVTRFQDAMTIKDIISGTLLSLVIDIIMVIVVGAGLFMINSTLFLIVMLIVIIDALLIFAFKNPYRRFNQRTMEQNAKMSSTIIESLSGIETVKISKAREKQESKINSDFAKLLNTTFSVGIFKNVQISLNSFLNSAGNLVLLFVGARLIMSGNLTLGDLMAFNALSSMFLGPISNLIGLQMSFQEVSIAANRLMEIMNVETEEERDEDKLYVNKLEGNIVLKDVKLNYGYREDVLKGISIYIRKGQKIGIVGETGSGKTSIAKLLMGFEQADNGVIAFDDISLDLIRLESLRDRIAYIPQTSHLFSGKIMDNLKLGNPNLTDKEIIDFCKIIGVHDFIEKLPNQYNTLVSEQATNLSGGQKQRIAIARALLKDFDILILDEATSQLDVNTEKLLKDKFDRLYRGKTEIIIAHRLSTVRDCDNIIVLNNGKIVEQGRHEDLLYNRGYYYKMYETQSESFEEKYYEFRI